VTGEDVVRSSVSIRAPAEIVWPFFVEPELLVQWIGIDADLEPVEGGRFRFELKPGEFCSGSYLEVAPPRRVVFTWGWESGALPVPPGSSRVEVNLEERGEITVVYLAHHGLSGEMRAMHAEGWTRFLARLAAVSEGRPAGEDPASRPDPRVTGTRSARSPNGR
jgi:uncharacterized protein YndB with AHSA1/START domain